MITDDIATMAEQLGVETVGGLRDHLLFRCFHCMRVYSGDDARDHFGLRMGWGPACVEPRR